MQAIESFYIRLSWSAELIMPSCEKCGTAFTRQSNLTRHIDEGRCKGATAKQVYTQIIPEYTVLPDSSLQTCPSFPDITKPTKKLNPKIEALADLIINGDSDDEEKDDEPVVKRIKKVSPTYVSSVIPERSIESIPPPITQKVIPVGGAKECIKSVVNTP